MRLLLLLFTGILLRAQAADSRRPLQMLMGEWLADGGECSFTLDLQGNVVIRKNHAEVRGARHDDLMVIYLEKDLKAIYWDNEGHVIHYKVEAEGDSVRFVSEQYRLTYRKDGADLVVDFDVAPPGKPFANYLHAKMRKK